MAACTLGLFLLLCCDALCILDIELTLVVLCEHKVTHDTEAAVGNPVNAESRRHDEADPDGHNGHHEVHGLHAHLSLSCLGRVGRLADLHRRPGKERRNDRDQEQADGRKDIGA